MTGRRSLIERLPLVERVDAKAHLSAVPADVEAGEEGVITRRGRPVARIVAEPKAGESDFSLDERFVFVDAQPMHESPAAGERLRRMREESRY